MIVKLQKQVKCQQKMSTQSKSSIIQEGTEKFSSNQEGNFLKSTNSMPSAAWVGRIASKFHSSRLFSSWLGWELFSLLF